MIALRPLVAADIDLVCHHRERMFADAGRPAEALAAMAAPFRAWLEPRLADGRYFGFVAIEAGEEVAGIGMMELDWPPHPNHTSEDRRGYVLNLYVEPDARRRGIALTLMKAAEEAFAARGISYLVLHASPDGKPLYAREGWNRTNEMAKLLQPSG